MDERGIEDAVVMDQKTFKSLTSETRTEILKLLKKRNHTLSEIAEALKISKTTAKEHLDVLVEGRLIEPVPSTNIWKYYTLTKDGKKLVGEEGPKRVVILIATCIFGILLSLYGAYGLMAPFGEQQPVTMATYDAGANLSEAVSEEKGWTGQAEAERLLGGEPLVETAEAAPPEEAEAVSLPMVRTDLPLAFIVIGLSIATVSLLLLIKGRKNRSVI